MTDAERQRDEDFRIAVDLRAIVDALIVVEGAARQTHNQAEDGCTDRPLHDALDALDSVRAQARGPEAGG